MWYKKVDAGYRDFTGDNRTRYAKRPNYITVDVWNTWQEEWNKEDYLKKCAIAKANRDKNLAPHTSGPNLCRSIILP